MPRIFRFKDWVRPDLAMTASAVILFAFGLVMIQSSTVTMVDGAFLTSYFVKQMAIGIASFALAALSYHYVGMSFWRRHSPHLLVFGLALLALVHVPGVGVSTKEGVNRWLDLGLMTFQPVEAVKLFLILYLSAYCARHNSGMRRLNILLPVAAVCVLLVFLLLSQPDYGSSVILVTIAMVIVFIAGARLAHFMLAGTLACVVAAFLLLSSPYRLARLAAFLKPFDDPLGAGYHQTHSLMAFGSGGWTGTGLGLSVEKWHHLPEAHNDFIISVIAEEFGFVGFTVVLLLYVVYVVRSVVAAEDALARGDRFSHYVLIGIATLFSLQVFINIGGNLAILPAKGLTLPLVSYGGSSLLVSMIMVSIALRAVREQTVPEELGIRGKFKRPEVMPWMR